VTRDQFLQKQSLPYEAKILHASKRAREFYDKITSNGGNCHVSVGGLDSITLLLFLRSIYINIPAVSVSSLEDKSIQAIHKQLGVEAIDPLMNKAEVIRRFGYPIISKKNANAIEAFQNPTEKNKQTRVLTLTGVNKNGKYNKLNIMAQKWKKLFVDQQAPFKVSEKCCYYIKEKPLDIWAKENNSSPYLGLMASEGGRRKTSLQKYGCNLYGKKRSRSCPFAIFSRQDLLQLALDLNVPIPEIYGTIERSKDGLLYTTKAQRTGCSMCGFGIHLDKRPHHFDQLYKENPKEWHFWMYDIGWGKVLNYIGVGWYPQMTLFDTEAKHGTNEA
jgi:hypothetical protein